MGALIHTLGGLIHMRGRREIGRFFWRNQRLTRQRSLVRVQHLPDGADVAPEVVVLRHLALDLFAAVEDR